MEWETFSGGMVLDLENFHLSTPTIGVAVRKRPIVEYRDRAVVFDRRCLRTVDGIHYTVLGHGLTSQHTRGSCEKVLPPLRV